MRARHLCSKQGAFAEQRMPFSGSAEAPTAVELADRRVIRLAGADVIHFLQVCKAARAGCLSAREETLRVIRATLSISTPVICQAWRTLPSRARFSCTGPDHERRKTAESG